MERILLVALGGAIGSVIRYLTSILAALSLGAEFPYGTLIVNLAGAFIIAGFGPDSILHTAGILKFSADLPIVIEVVDSGERLESLLPEVDRMMKGGLITMEKVRVIRYERGG